MSTFHFRVGIIKRSKGHSIARRLRYITGISVSDNYLGITHYGRRQDVYAYKIYLPEGAPERLNSLQQLCDEINDAEKRIDSQTGRDFICALPNELPMEELEEIVGEFITENFTAVGIFAVAAIHTGINEKDHGRDNPHVHIIIPTRTLTPNGFSPKKFDEFGRNKCAEKWRESWAEVQNHAYERVGLDIRVSHKSLEEQGIDREPMKHMRKDEYEKYLYEHEEKSWDRSKRISDNEFYPIDEDLSLSESEIEDRDRGEFYPLYPELSR